MRAIRPENELVWIDRKVDGRPYGVHVLVLVPDVLRTVQGYVPVRDKMVAAGSRDTDHLCGRTGKPVRQLRSACTDA